MYSTRNAALEARSGGLSAGMERHFVQSSRATTREETLSGMGVNASLTTNQKKRCWLLA